MDQNTGKYIIISGAFLVLAGILVYFFHDKMNWFGRLPGDIRIEKENSRIYIPVTTMILVSILLSVLVHFLRKWF